jgi:transcriptional regulator with XRE-family HTH domain
MTAPSKEPDIPGETLREYLKRENMTEAELAAYLNVDPTTVNRWVNDKAKPTGTAKAVLWTLLGLAGLAAGIGAPMAGAAGVGLGLFRGASSAARLLQAASIAGGAVSSCVGLYKLLKQKFAEDGPDDATVQTFEEEILRQKQEHEQRISQLRAELEEEERKLREIDKKTRKEG